MAPPFTPRIFAADLTVEMLKERLSYDPETGIFRWLNPTSTSLVAGDIAGTPDINGYIVIKLFRSRHFAHRLAWFYSFGVWPALLIDHRDGNPSNNVLSNLREATREQNGHNRVAAGFSYSKRNGKFGTSICVNKKVNWLGYFETAEAARSAYLDAHAKLTHEFSVTRRQPLPSPPVAP